MNESLQKKCIAVDEVNFLHATEILIINICTPLFYQRIIKHVTRIFLVGWHITLKTD